ncbi:MAG: AraC family transcriptional regulator [Cyanobacteria bacterium P01_F01_bin.143]
MKNTPMQKPEVKSLSPLPGCWENLLVEQFQPAPGEGTCHSDDEHTIFMSLAARPVRLLHIQDGKTSTGMYGQGDMCITPAKIPIFARWDSDDHYLRMRLKTQFIQNTARETLERDCDCLALIPECQIRNPQIEAIAMMLLAEMQQEQVTNKLYIDSLTNVLAVNLLRNHAASKPRVPIYEGGLPPRQLEQVLDYIDAHLAQNIKLADLARLLDISQFHFSRLFKQSLGTTPHKYLSQQRVERAKQLLSKTDQAIIDIALECGFSSHSHLSKQFRQFTGMTPKAYRTI